MTHCPLCHQAASFSTIETHIDGGVTYSLFECPLCHAQFWTPLRNPGANWYEHDERYAGANKNPPIEPNLNHRRTIAHFGTHTGRVLDIGCGTGNFLSWAARHGWETYGIDFDRNAITAAREFFALPQVEVASLEELYAKKPGLFDLITFFDVFEHVDNHHAFIDMVRNLLSANGAIALSVPYRDGSRWLQPNDVPPRHLTRWNETALRGFLERTGFTVELMEIDPLSVSDIAVKLRLRYGRLVSFNLVGRIRALLGGPKRVVAKQGGEAVTLIREPRAVGAAHMLARAKDLLIFGPAAVVVALVLGRKGRSTGLFVIARKKADAPKQEML